MKHNAKKILSLLLSFVLVLSLVPAAAAVSDEDIFKLRVKMFNLADEKMNAGDSAAVEELYDAIVDLEDAYDQARGEVTPAVETAYNSALAVYLKYTAVAVDDVFISDKTVTLTVGGKQTLTASISPDDATDKKVKWSVGGTDAGAVTLYTDANCQTPLALNTATDTLTVYAKGISAGTATVTATSNADANKTATCSVTVNAATYTVTYKPGDEATGEDQTVTVSKNEQGTYTHNIQKYEDSFTAPEGKVFDYWQGSDGNTYKYGDTVTLTANLTLTAQWKDKEEQQGGKKTSGGSGSGFDLVFNIPGEDNSWGYGGGYAPQRAYRVSLAPMQGGSAALGLTTGESTETAMNVYPTTTVYVFPNAEQGYMLDKIVWSLIDGSASYDITEAKNFVMPAMDAVVYVTFKPVG